MAEANHDQADQSPEERQRASLRGKGREILLGQHGTDLDDALTDEPEQPTAEGESGDVNAASLALTAEETNELLDLGSTAPDVPLPAANVPAAEPVPAPNFDAWWEADDTPAPTDADADSASAPFTPPTDAPPLAERSLAEIEAEDRHPYRPATKVEALTPLEPEFAGEAPVFPVETVPVPVPRGPIEGPYSVAGEEGGPVIVPEGAVPVADPTPVGLPEPFEPVYERQPAEKLFDTTEPAAEDLLHLLVDDAAIRKLAQQIEAVQEEIATHVANDRDSADVYMNELLRASSLLMASRENYDDAKAIVFRVRADMKRELKIEEDIRRFRPALMNYYFGWGVTLGVLYFFKQMITGISDAVGVEAFAAMYYPMLFGIAGALISGYLTLERHTTRLRDFDPIHISWYLFNPLLGAVMGLIMFLLAGIANEDLLSDSGSTAELAITYLLCVIAGMNQNNVLRQLNNLLKRTGQGGGED